MELLNSSSVLQVGVRQFGKENLALYLKSVDYNGNMSIVNAIILSFFNSWVRASVPRVIAGTEICK